MELGGECRMELGGEGRMELGSRRASERTIRYSTYVTL